MKKLLVLLLTLITTGQVFSLEPDQLLLIANADDPNSLALAKYYQKKRDIPKKHLLLLSLGETIETISRSDYDNKLAKPLRQMIFKDLAASDIECLVTFYGIPIKVTGRGPLKNKQKDLTKLNDELARQKKLLALFKQNQSTSSQIQLKQKENEITQLKTQIAFVNGSETDASVDSELSMLKYGDYELYRWQKNRLASPALFDFRTLMVSRIDGPSLAICRRIIDDSIAAEKTGPGRNICVDIGWGGPGSGPAYENFDTFFEKTARLFEQRNFNVTTEDSRSVFQPLHNCRDVFIYTGWYSLQNYVDAFDFRKGAIGYHVASLEATDLRNPDSKEWCPSLLKDGVAATIGAVAEPYLHTFPKPHQFFEELLDGKTVVEAYYRTKPFNSWRQMLIADPLYRPFKK